MISPSRVDRPVVRLALVVSGLTTGASDHTPEEQACLRRWATGRRRAAELGVAEGRGTCILSSVMQRDGVVYAVDPFPPGRLRFSVARLVAHVGVRRVHGTRVEWLRMRADEAYGQLHRAGEVLDFVFSDACFSYEELDDLWHHWSELIAPSGVFVQSTSRPVAPRADSGHDTVRWTNDVLVRDPRFRVVDEVGTFTVLQRAGGSSG